MIVSLTGFFTTVLSFLFSDASQRGKGSSTSVTFCRVRIDKKTGTRYFYFRFRRFVYDAASYKFMYGSWDVQEGQPIAGGSNGSYYGEDAQPGRSVTIGEWLDSSYLHQGLCNDEAVKRRGIVGPNVLELKKPTVIGSIYNEFSKPFYLYQTFMVWTWGEVAIFSYQRNYFIPANKSAHRHFSTILVLLHGHCQYFHSSYWWYCGCGVSVHK